MNPHMDAVHDLHDLHRPGAPVSLTPQNEANYPGLGWSGVNVLQLHSDSAVPSPPYIVHFEFGGTKYAILFWGCNGIMP